MATAPCGPITFYYITKLIKANIDINGFIEANITTRDSKLSFDQVKHKIKLEEPNAIIEKELVRKLRAVKDDSF